MANSMTVPPLFFLHVLHALNGSGEGTAGVDDTNDDRAQYQVQTQLKEDVEPDEDDGDNHRAAARDPQVGGKLDTVVHKEEHGAQEKHAGVDQGIGHRRRQRGPKAAFFLQEPVEGAGGQSGQGALDQNDGHRGDGVPGEEEGGVP